MEKETVNRTELDSGVRIITDRMSHVRSVSIGVWIRVGSSNETIQNNGISHFLEHSLFKGTKKRSARQIAQSLESLGGSLNASTGKEISLYTAYILDEHYSIAVEVLSDLLQNPRLAKKDIELEKNVVLSEIKHSLEDPEELTIDNFYQNLFRNHPLGFQIQGTPENIINFNKNDLLRFMREEYTADRIVFAAAGNIEHKRFVDRVNMYFHHNPRLSSSSSRFSLSNQFSNRYYKYTVPSVQQAHICVGARTFGYNDDRKYTMVLLEMIFGGGMSSRLFQNIREQYGFAYSVYSFLDFMANIGVFGAYMACDARRTETSVELLNQEFKKLTNIHKPELELVKAQARGTIILGLESSSRRMRRIGENEIYDNPMISKEELMTKIESITIDDIKSIAKEYLNEANLITIVSTPN